MACVMRATARCIERATKLHGELTRYWKDKADAKDEARLCHVGDGQAVYSGVNLFASCAGEGVIPTAACGDCGRLGTVVTWMRYTSACLIAVS
jgi:hypothetical protein